MSATGRFFLRVDEKESAFVRHMGDRPPCDGMVVHANYLAEYPKDHRDHGKNPRDLADAAHEVGLPWRVDPGTAALMDPKVPDGIGRRAANNPYARLFELPVTIAVLQRPGNAEAWVEAGTDLQLTSEGFAAPYIEVSEADGPEVEINCRLISLAEERSSSGEVVAYLQCTKGALLDGTADRVALQFVEAGASLVFLRIRRFKPEEANAGESLAYMRLVQAIFEAGARAVPDCVGRLGPPLLPAGAEAFATNARRFRKLPDDLFSRAGGGSPPMPWEVPGEMYNLTPGNLRRDMLACPTDDCGAKQGEGKPQAMRVHNLHEFHRLARQAGREGFDFSRTLMSVEGKQAQIWGEALAALQRGERAA